METLLLTSDGNNAVSITMGKSEISGNAVISSENSKIGETTDYAVTEAIS